MKLATTPICERSGATSPPPWASHYWYWARGHVGPYTVLTYPVTAARAYHLTTIPALLLTRDGKVVTRESGHLAFQCGDKVVEQSTGGLLAASSRHVYTDGDEQFTIELAHRRTLRHRPMVAGMDVVHRALSDNAGFNGVYLRFTGAMTITHTCFGQVLDQCTGPANWGLLYFAQ